MRFILCRGQALGCEFLALAMISGLVGDALRFDPPKAKSAPLIFSSIDGLIPPHHVMRAAKASKMEWREHSRDRARHVFDLPAEMVVSRFDSLTGCTGPRIA